jgi:glycolate oxidase
VGNRGKYNPVTPKVADELRTIVGAKYVIYEEKERLEPYSHDEIPGKEYAYAPEVVVRPRSAEEIAAIMKLANREMIAVTPRGAGSGLSGGAVPIYGGIVITTDRLNKILEIDVKNMMLVVEPGVVTNEINDFLKEYGLFYAGYPMSLETCYIGGNVAENAGGARAIKYGVTSRYVLGLEVVTPTGEIVEMGGKLLKDVSGYSMVQLMVGSEGTLGIFTKIILWLIPLPKAQVDLLCLFKTPEESLEVVPKIVTSSGIVPAAIEFMDTSAVQAACEYLNESIPYRQAGAMLLITVDGADEQQVEREYESIGELCLDAGAIEVYIADNATTSERIWKVRRNIGEAYNVISCRQSPEDIVMPPATICAMIAKMKNLSAEYDVMIPCFGHAADGNIHARIVSQPEWSDEKWHETLPKILDELYRLTAEVGGRISGEHGIGHKRKKYLPRVVSENYIDMLRAVKKAMDPNNILNPGKIFDL